MLVCFFSFGNIYFDIILSGVFTDNHSFVNRCSGSIKVIPRPWALFKPYFKAEPGSEAIKTPFLICGTIGEQRRVIEKDSVYNGCSFGVG